MNPGVDHLSDVEDVVADVQALHDAALDVANGIFKDRASRNPKSEGIPPELSFLFVHGAEERLGEFLSARREEVYAEDAGSGDFSFCARPLLCGEGHPRGLKGHLGEPVGGKGIWPLFARRPYDVQSVDDAPEGRLSRLRIHENPSPFICVDALLRPPAVFARGALCFATHFDCTPQGIRCARDEVRRGVCGFFGGVCGKMKSKASVPHFGG